MNEITKINRQEVTPKIAQKNENFRPNNSKKSKSCSNLNGMNLLGNYNKVLLNKPISFKSNMEDDDDLSDILLFLEEMSTFLDTIDDEQTEETVSAADVYNTESDWNDRFKQIENLFELTDVSTVDIKTMMQEFFANDVEIEATLKNADFAVYGKNGIPLKYTRKEFISDLNTLLQDSTEKNLIMEKIGISPIYSKDGSIIGYDGILDCNNLNRENEEEEKTYKIIHRFLKENEVVTDDIRLNKALTALIKGMPEFINIIGKRQHEQQDYSLDIHILNVLQKAMADKKYEQLEDVDKTILKWSVIMHDISKPEDKKDYMHPVKSAQYARKIMERYKFPIHVKDRIYEQIKNHHWLAQYNNGYMTPEDVAVIFRQKNDINIARIIAEADIKSIDKNGNFWRDFSTALAPEKQNLIDIAQREQDKSGQLIHISRITNYGAIPNIEYKGNAYKVIDLSNISDEELSSIYTSGTKKEDLRYCMHVVSNDDDAVEKLETLYSLGDIASDNEVSASYVSFKDKKTINDYQFGLSLDASPRNISNAYNGNQYSGTFKNVHDFIKQVQAKEDMYKEYRKMIPGIIKMELSLNDDEYAELFRMLSENSSSSRIYTNSRNSKTGKQIYINKKFKINDKVITGEDIIKAVRKAGDEILRNTTDFNEICMYKPKTNAFIAKVDKIDEIPERYLKFVREHNLPIILLGK